ncbi:MAG TPA: septal ring lytic transglycosylase RlpA family protein, partial [bacterium]|nr:septal ring lytic transglycosylase RlpA family protein [bacterium]
MICSSGKVGLNRKKGTRHEMKRISPLFVLLAAGFISDGLRCSHPHVAPPRPRAYAARRPIRVYHGKASYYGGDFHGRKTASGEVFDQHGLTAAHKTWPFGTVCRVIHRRNGKAVIVRINDRGPFIQGRIL